MFVGWSLPHTRGYHVALKTQKTPPVQVHTLQNLKLPFSHTRVLLIALKGTHTAWQWCVCCIVTLVSPCCWLVSCLFSGVLLLS